MKYLICIVLLAGGFLGMLGLAELEEEPETARAVSRKLAVSVMEAGPEDVAVTLTGYGEAAVLESAVVSAETQGTLAYLNPRLKPGEILPKGELLFRVDDSRYQAKQKALEAVVSRLENRIREMAAGHGIDKKRLAIAEKNQTLARAEFKRLKGLFQKNVGSRSGMDRAEQALNTARDQVAEFSQAVTTHPQALAQVRAELAEARANLSEARLDVARCRVYAPFDGRVESVSAKQGEYMTQGRAVAELADDTVLEIPVALDSREANQWLEFEKGAADRAWFSSLTPVACRIYPTDYNGPGFHTGSLHRVVRFNPACRTLVVAVRLDAGIASSPLVGGMFCRVEIPGRTLKQVVRLPESALGGNKYLCLSRKGKLKKVPMEVVRIEGPDAFIRAALDPGDRVIVTPLENPVEDSELIHIPNN